MTAVNIPTQPDRAAGYGWRDVMSFRVSGLPVGQGRITTFGKGMTTHSNKAQLVVWRQTVGWAATQAAHHNQTGPTPIDQPVRLGCVFTLPKPVNAPKRRRTVPSRKPDLSHLVRAVEDALVICGVLKDDARIVECQAVKCYPGEHPYALPAPGVAARLSVLDLGEWL